MQTPLRNFHQINLDFCQDQELISKLLSSYRYDPETGSITNIATGKIKHGKTGNGYIMVNIHHNGKQTNVGGHRFAWLAVYGYLPTLQVDHINGDRADNRIANLREATSQQQRFNSRVGTRKSKTSRYKGVCLREERNKPWYAQIRKDNISHSLGYYRTEEEAAEAYNQAAVRMFGEFARINVF